MIFLTFKIITSEMIIFKIIILI